MVICTSPAASVSRAWPGLRLRFPFLSSSTRSSSSPPSPSEPYEDLSLTTYVRAGMASTITSCSESTNPFKAMVFCDSETSFLSLILLMRMSKDTLPPGYAKKSSMSLISSAWSCEIRGVCVVGRITAASKANRAYFTRMQLSLTVLFLSILTTEVTGTSFSVPKSSPQYGFSEIIFLALFFCVFWKLTTV